jgi:uncharacterized DUF497 family protein
MDGFDWDEGNIEKCCKHGILLEEIENLFRRPIDIHPDLAHSLKETRFFGIGQTEAGRHVFLAFTVRIKDNKRFIRPISARYMHAKEIAHYVEEIARRED